jgi:hypothetical protein
MKKFKIYGVPQFNDGEIVTYKEIIERRRGGFLEKSWDGTVSHWKSFFSPAWRLVRVKRRFEIIEFGDWWGIPSVKVGAIWSKKELINGFPEQLTICLGYEANTDWDGTLEDLNIRMSHIDRINNSRIVFKEVYIEVEDK